MTTIPRSVVNARRTAGGILVLSALGTVIMLIILAAWWSTQPPSVAGAMGTPSNTPAVSASVPQQPVLPQHVSPQVALQQEVDRDRQQVETLVDYWMPQLSSKNVGLKADGITYGYGEILDHFNRLKARYPQVLLLRSDDYASFKANGYWVAMMPLKYANGTEANSWCDAQNIDLDNCFAKLLRHTGGTQGATLSRK